MEGITCGVSLPEKLLMEIFSWLSVDTLLRFKCVSKSFCNMINCPQFVKLHLSRSLNRNPGVVLLHSADYFLATFDFNHPQRPLVQLHLPDVYIPATVVGVSNGVVCFRMPGLYIDCVLYNPATRASKQVPRPQIKLQNYGFGSYQYEFGYDSIDNDYKILCVVDFSKELFMHPICPAETYIYSLKSDSWQSLENPPWSDCWVGESCSVVANNSFYWDLDNRVIARFDLSSHTYEEIERPFPPEVTHFYRVRDNISLGVLKGCVHAMRIGRGIAIWTLNEDGEWTKLFHRPNTKPRMSDWPLPYAYSKDGKKILVGVEENMKAFVCCELNSRTTTTVNVLGLPKGATFTAAPWVESLVQLG